MSVSASVESTNPGVAMLVYKDFPKHLCTELLIPKATVTLTTHLHSYFQSVLKITKTYLQAGHFFYALKTRLQVLNHKETYSSKSNL